MKAGSKSPDLDGADGSAVSITVVDQQVDDALTVPIAAVKQNGSGRTWSGSIDRQNGKDHRGTGHHRPDRRLVHPGQQGVSNGQTVVVEVDQPQ